mmetsp:Transcript_80503/g.225894  ORF Transcript_80503/g.225894 Transcript_80503/m.225894 type:complete len:256 (+) Transcript_80503:602-1369(+)
MVLQRVLLATRGAAVVVVLAVRLALLATRPSPVVVVVVVLAIVGLPCLSQLLNLLVRKLTVLGAVVLYTSEFLLLPGCVAMALFPLVRVVVLYMVEFLLVDLHDPHVAVVVVRDAAETVMFVALPVVETCVVEVRCAVTGSGQKQVVVVIVGQVHTSVHVPVVLKVNVVNQEFVKLLVKLWDNRNLLVVMVCVVVFVQLLRNAWWVAVALVVVRAAVVFRLALDNASRVVVEVRVAPAEVAPKVEMLDNLRAVGL